LVTTFEETGIPMPTKIEAGNPNIDYAAAIYEYRDATSQEFKQ